MRSLYHIEQSLAEINDQIIASSGELTPELETQLAITQSELSEKARNYGLVILSNESDINAIDAEIKRLQALKAPIEATNKKLKEAISNAMQTYGIEKIDSPLCKLSFRKSTSVEVDETLLNQKWFKYVASPDKTLIKEAIKSGEIIDGAEIVEKLNLQVK
jgi:hypothetical protein